MFIAETISRVWNEPKSSFMAGILYGSRSGLPPELTDLFNKTGVTHIIAVSGSNISIIAVAVMSTLVASGLHRRRATYVVGGFIVVLFSAQSGLELTDALQEQLSEHGITDDDAKKVLLLRFVDLVARVKPVSSK
jgi:hypothetical protein